MAQPPFSIILKSLLFLLVILYDNRILIFLVASPISHKRSKHIGLDYHFVQEQVASRKLQVQYVPAHLELVDMFMKHFGCSTPIFLHSKLCV